MLVKINEILLILLQLSFPNAFSYDILEVVDKITCYYNSKTGNENVAHVELQFTVMQVKGHAHNPVAELHGHHFVEIFLHFSLPGKMRGDASVEDYACNV